MGWRQSLVGSPPVIGRLPHGVGKNLRSRSLKVVNCVEMPQFRQSCGSSRVIEAVSIVDGSVTRQCKFSLKKMFGVWTGPRGVRDARRPLRAALPRPCDLIIQTSKFSTQIGHESSEQGLRSTVKLLPVIEGRGASQAWSTGEAQNPEE
jgi:hypothetical protein